MSEMSSGKEKITILGGGISALTAAYELTKTPELAGRYDITLYQMGWRLGGKLASGRKKDAGYRNEEHGLHVWFGFYENSFALIKNLYREFIKNIKPDYRFKEWHEVFKPQSFTPVGQITDDQYGYLNILWPTNADEPGDGSVELTPWGAITEFINLIKIIIEKLFDEKEKKLFSVESISSEIHALFEQAIGHHPAKDIKTHLPGKDAAPQEIFRSVQDWARSLGEAEKTESLKMIEHSEGLMNLLKHCRKHILPEADRLAAENVDAHVLRNALDVGLAFLIGLFNPEYGIPEDWDLNRIDHMDFREWLIENGGNPAIINEWSALRAFYDTPFAYESGDTSKPNFAAGTAARAIIRIAATYKGAVLYLVQAGMGECIIAPLYKFLKFRGVKFEFFHKARDMEVSPDGHVITRVVLDRQASTVNNLEYDPVYWKDNFFYWPSEPLWEQLQEKYPPDGKPDFESHWCTVTSGEPRILEVGRDFDRVILGISLGGIKKLNNSDRPLGAELITRNSRFAAMSEKLGLIPTMGVQLWTNKDLKGLGWTAEKPAAVGGAEPLDVWTDMSQTLEYENWPDGKKPGSVQYICGCLNTDMYKSPISDSETPAKGLAQTRDETAKWLDAYAYSMWPDATGTNPKTGLDMNELFAPDNLTGRERLNYQWLKANIDPTECCIGSFAGTTKYRIYPYDTGFVNLYATGAWTRSGMNLTCVEGAVMSGMMAARAITGRPLKIVGENFMQKK